MVWGVSRLTVTIYQDTASFVEWFCNNPVEIGNLQSGVDPFYPYPFHCSNTEEATIGAPDATFVTPVPTAEVGRMEAIVVDVTNATGPLSRVFIAAMESVSWAQELVFDGEAFTPNYDGGSYMAAIEHGIRFHVLRDRGWPAGRNVSLRVFLHDSSGLDVVSDSELETIFFVYPYPEACPSAPVVTYESPLPGSEIEADDVIVFTIQATSGELTQVLIVCVNEAGTHELVFDGISFSARFSGSSREDISRGYRFRVSRRGGWEAGSVNFKTYAIDSVGQVS